MDELEVNPPRSSYWRQAVSNELFFQGVDLRQYSKQIETDLREVEDDSIQDCIFSFSILSQDLFIWIWMAYISVSTNIFLCLIIIVEVISQYRKYLNGGYDRMILGQTILKLVQNTNNLFVLTYSFWRWTHFIQVFFFNLFNKHPYGLNHSLGEWLLDAGFP